MLRRRAIDRREVYAAAAATAGPYGDRQAIELVRHRKFNDATTLAATIGDPLARKLVEWTLLHDSENPAGSDRYAAFIQVNADWPSISMLRRRAEAKLWQERRTPPPCAASLTGNLPAVLAVSRWRECCRVKATALAPSAKFARCGSRRKCRPNWKPLWSEAFPDSLTSVDRRAHGPPHWR